MDIYSAVMKAADHIERNPQEFNFNTAIIPRSAGCGTPGCALGWIGTFAGLWESWGGCGDLVPGYLGLSPGTHPRYGGATNPHPTFAFYSRMDAAYGSHEWIHGAAECANALRLYAAKYLKPAPRYDFEALAERLSREPKLEDAPCTANP